jgi:iron complex outermembrane receptor protein
VPFVPSLSVRARLLPWLQLHGQAGRTFRLPTFNDRYWSPGGQPGLRPEQGWHQELGLRGEWQQGDWQGQLHLSAFSQQIDNWILWRPGPSYWFPENLRTVWSRGLETGAKLAAQAGDWQGQLRLAYTYTRATITATEGARDQSRGKQLIYTPEHQGRLALQGQWRAFSLHYTHAFTGYRYTTSDNSAFLPGYDLGSVYLQHRWQRPRWQLRGSLRCDNLWGRDYEVLAARPMPRQVLSLGLDVVFAGTPSP